MSDRNLTDEDIKAIAAAVSANCAHCDAYTDEERVILKRLVKSIGKVSSFVGLSVMAAVLGGIYALIKMGADAWKG